MYLFIILFLAFIKWKWLWLHYFRNAVLKCRADNGATYNFKSDDSFLSFSKCCLILTTPLSTIYLWTSLKKESISCYLTKNLALKFIIYSNVCALNFVFFYFRWLNGRCNTLNILISLYRRALTLQLAHLLCHSVEINP